MLTADESGIVLRVGDIVRFENPTPGENGLPLDVILVGIIVSFGGSLCTINVASSTALNTAFAVYNVACREVLQIHSGQVGDSSVGRTSGC